MNTFRARTVDSAATASAAKPLHLPTGAATLKNRWGEAPADSKHQRAEAARSQRCHQAKHPHSDSPANPMQTAAPLFQQDVRRTTPHPTRRAKHNASISMQASNLMAALHCARHLLTAICLTASCHADITAGLRSWYPFEGNANDSSGSGNNGTIQGSPRFAAGQSGSGIRLTGPSDWVDIGPDTRLNTFTLAAWVRMDADANPPPSSDSRTSMDIFADGSSLQNFGIYVDRQFGGTQTQRFAGHAGSLYVYSTTQPQIGRLYHVAFSFDSAGIGKLYVDGVLESTASGGVIGTGATPDAKLGVRNNSAEYFKGLIDEARIYDRELSPAEIAQLSHPERVFADDFNRPDSAAVGNGWLDTTGNNGGNFGIVNGTLGVPNVPGGAGIYRPVPANQSIHIQCKLLDTTSSLRRGRYEHRVLLRNDGTRFKGYGLMLGRTDSALNNSMIHLISDEVILSSVKPSFEFPVPLYLDATYSPDGSVQGTVSGAETYSPSVSLHGMFQWEVGTSVLTATSWEAAPVTPFNVWMTWRLPTP